METNNPSVKQTITEKVNSYQQQIQNQNKKIVSMMKSELGVDPDKAFNKSVQANANGTETVMPQREDPAPREGDSAFKHGYSNGFMNLDYHNTYTGRDYTNYDNGYNLGYEDRDAGTPERWRYVPKAKPAGLNPAAQWPFPKRD